MTKERFYALLVIMLNVVTMNRLRFSSVVLWVGGLLCIAIIGLVVSQYPNITQSSKDLSIETFFGSGLYGADEFRLDDYFLEKKSWSIIRGELQTSNKTHKLTQDELAQLISYIQKENLLQISGSECGMFSRCSPDGDVFRVRIQLHGQSTSFDCVVSSTGMCAKASKELVRELMKIIDAS